MYEMENIYHQRSQINKNDTEVMIQLESKQIHYD
jgi:hypothetical protein